MVRLPADPSDDATPPVDATAADESTPPTGDPPTTSAGGDVTGAVDSDSLPDTSGTTATTSPVTLTDPPSTTSSTATTTDPGESSSSGGADTDESSSEATSSGTDGTGTTSETADGDLGGVHGPQSGGVELDTLGLSVGASYALDVFHAERHTSQSNFKITTSICSTPQ